MYNLRMYVTNKMIDKKSILATAIYFEEKKETTRNKKFQTIDAIDITELQETDQMEDVLLNFLRNQLNKVNFNFSEDETYGSIGFLSFCEPGNGNKKYKEIITKLDFLDKINCRPEKLKRIDLIGSAIIDQNMKFDLITFMRDFVEQKTEKTTTEQTKLLDNQVEEVKLPIQQKFLNKKNAIKKYKKVIDIHTDGSVKFFKGQPIISFGGNIIKRTVEDSIFYNFKRICGFEFLKEDSQYAELKAVEESLSEIIENHSKEIDSETLIKIYIDNEQVVDVLKSGFMWRNASEKAMQSFYKVKGFQKKYHISFTKVSSKKNKGNMIAHNLAKKAYKIATGSKEHKFVENPSPEFKEKLKNQYFLKRAQENYSLLINNLDI